MKIEKNKIVFGSVLAVVIIFIIAYSLLVFGVDGDEPAQLKQTQVPELEQEQEEYQSKLDAVNAIKEEREINAPSIYNEKLLDSLGYYDPELRNKQKERIVDSIYRHGRINYTENSYRSIPVEARKESTEPVETSLAEDVDQPSIPKELGLVHQLFYSSNPNADEANLPESDTQEVIHVEVDGNQVVKAGYRLQMRTTEAAVINDKIVPENTAVYGFIRFQVNRALIEIENVDHQAVKLKAYDLQDGSEGIYVENSFRADASREVMDDVIQDIDFAGIPQVGGIRKVFQRNNRNVKVTVTNNYKLILKASQGQ